MPFISLVLVLATQGNSTDGLAQTWASVESSIRHSYYARYDRRSEMESRFAAYEPLALAAKSRFELRDVVNKMIGEFHDSHFEFDIEGDQGYYLNDSFSRAPAAQMANIGAWFRKTLDGYTVQMVLDGSAAEKAGLRKGDLMISIDGNPFTPVAGFEPDAGRTARIKFSDAGNEIERDVAVEREPALKMFLDATIQSEREIDLPDGRRFGYIHPWTLVNGDFRRAVHQAVEGRFASTDGFILDLRDGFGGRPEGFDDAFLPSSTKEGEKPGYTKPLVILINDGSRSAREILSYKLRKAGRATLIGRKTSGNVLGTMPFRVNSWSTLEIPIVNVKIDGVRLEGVGVMPDLFVPQERDSNGVDMDLEAGVRYLKTHTPTPISAQSQPSPRA